MTPPPDAHALRLHLDMSSAHAASRVAAAQRALDATPPTDHARRASLLAARAISESLTTPEQAAATLHEAEEALRAITSGPASDSGPSSSSGAADDPELATSPDAVIPARVAVLLAHFALDLSPRALESRVRLATEALDLLADAACADARDDLGPAAYFAYLSALMESGDVQRLDAALSAQSHPNDHVTDLLDHRFALWFRCSRAAMDGRLQLAERLAHEAYGVALRADDADAQAVLAGQTAVIRWMQGRISEMEPTFLHARQTDPTEPVWGAAVAWIWVHQGRRRAARGLLDSLPPPDTFPQGRNYLATLTLLAEALAIVGDPAERATLRRLLTPYSDRVVTMGLGIASWGTVARPLALLARADRDLDAARRWYLASIDLCSRIGAQPWLARAQVELAAIVAEQGEIEPARELATEAGAAARSLGLRYIEQQVDRLHRHLAGPGAVQPSASGAGPQPIYLAAGPIPLFPAPPTPAAGASQSSQSSPSRSPQPPSAQRRGGHTTAAQLTGRPDPATTSDARHPRVTILGQFAVTYDDGSTATFRSRKAATLLKILIARRGAPLARETAMDLLWPDEDPGRLHNRLSVALTAVRRSLDPQRRHPANHYLRADAGAARLNLAALSVDVEEFFALAEQAHRVPESRRDEREALLRRTLACYAGDALADEPYAAWAEQLREQAHLTFFGVSHALATLVTARSEHLAAVELYRGIIALDPYDLAAHDGLIGALTELGAAAHVAAAQTERLARQAELGLTAG